MPRTATAPSNGATDKTKADFERHASRIRDDISSLASSISTAGGALAEDAKSNAGAKAAEIRQASEQTVRELRTQLAAIERRLEAHVRERPVASLALAAGAGFLAALLMRR